MDGLVGVVCLDGLVGVEYQDGAGLGLADIVAVGFLGGVVGVVCLVGLGVE